jgi:Family of unknown function (DUF6125)
MVELSDAQIAEYFRRSYTAVDGLWFMKVEDRLGFDLALEIDTAVWKIMPKIQARALKSLTGLGDGIEALFKCFTAKLSLEGFVYTAEWRGAGFHVTITRCPWHDLRVKSARPDISGKVGDTICHAENLVWAKEFGDGIVFVQRTQLCKDEAVCVMDFGISETIRDRR